MPACTIARLGSWAPLCSKQQQQQQQQQAAEAEAASASAEEAEGSHQLIVCTAKLELSAAQVGAAVTAKLAEQTLSAAPQLPQH